MKQNIRLLLIDMHKYLMATLNIFKKIPAKYPRLRKQFICKLSYKLKRSVPCKKWIVLLATTTFTKVFLPGDNHNMSVCSISTLFILNHFITQNIKRTCTQGLRINKNNYFYCLIKDILHCNYLFLFFCKCMVVQRMMTSSIVWCH